MTPSSSPRSIEEYLRELRAALAGADPALIQDALYDAEVTGLAIGVSFTLVPLAGLAGRLGWVPWDHEEIGFSPAWLDTSGGWILCGVFGVVVLTTLLHAARAVVGLHARTAKTLLLAQGT